MFLRPRYPKNLHVCFVCGFYIFRSEKFRMLEGHRIHEECG